MPRDQTGLLIIRAWVQPGSTKPLRAQVKLTTDIAAGFDREITLADVEGVCSVVETWLEDVLLTNDVA